MSEWLEHLSCPKCQSSKWSPQANASLSCLNCRNRYPILDGIPVLFQDPEAFLQLWTAKLQGKLRELQHRHQSGPASAEFPTLPETTRQRLERVSEAEFSNVSKIQSLLPETLASFQPAGGIGPANTDDLGIKNTQHFDSYIETVFRDWVWGEDEIQSMLNSISSRLSKHIQKPEFWIAALGSGAGRIVTELAQAMPETRWLGVDINPFLLQIHRRMLLQESVKFSEISRNPRSLTDVTKEQTLKANVPPGVSERIHLVASDGLNPSFPSKSLDAVFCSWWVDIIPDDLQRVVQRLNRVLTPGGLLIIHGPLGFLAPHEAKSYTEEEILEWMPLSGFEAVEIDRMELPYLHSPQGRLKRTELLSWMVFRKVAETRQPSAYKSLPDYLLNLDAPIGPAEEFRARAVDSALKERIYSLIDGKRSVNDIAQWIASGLQIDLPAAKTLLQQILMSKG